MRAPHANWPFFITVTTAEDGSDVTNNSAGGYVTVNMMAGSFGVGAHRYSSNDLEDQQATFVSYVTNLPVEGSQIKIGYGVATAGKNESNLFRIRFNYTF